MSQYIFYFATNSPALRAAGAALKEAGYTVAAVPGQQVTHLVLPVPSLTPEGTIKGDGDLSALLQQLPDAVTIIGGNLPAHLHETHPVIDLLRDARYLAQNALITAYCAIRIAMMELPVTLLHCKTLLIGWGRISQCLAQLLGALGADVTVAARKESDRAMAQALGYQTADPAKLSGQLHPYRLIFNTAPAPVITEEDSKQCNRDCIKIDLASVLGIGGHHVIWAKGLPGKDAPESSGVLIAQTILRLLQEKEESL